jgi:hypothetical protein
VKLDGTGEVESIDFSSLNLLVNAEKEKVWTIMPLPHRLFLYFSGWCKMLNTHQTRLHLG